MEQDVRDLAGRKALVLGANEPVAAAIALALARAGADVAVTSSSGDPEEAFALRPLRRVIEAEGRQAIADIADLGNGSSVQIAVRQIARQLGRIDIAVIAARAPVEKAVERMTDGEWSRATGLGLGAYFYACRAIVRELEHNEPVDGVRGRIVAVVPAVEPGPGVAVGEAARAGALALVRALGRDWAERGVAVNAVALNPGTRENEAVEAALELVAAGIEVAGQVREPGAR